ncbi:MAG: hypothetical protein NTV54_15490 [Ignavibacteriales bacterium]|nr:hypothetical protein [Ignavibacteriales bacterium]
MGDTMTSIEDLTALRKAEIAAKDALRAKNRSDLRKFFSGMLVGDSVGALVTAYVGKQAYLNMWIDPMIAVPCATITLAIAVWLYLKK